MNPLYDKIGLTFDLLGSVLVAYTVIMVHYRFRKEHRVDERVFSTMRREHFIAIIGVLCIVVGYIFQFIAV